MRREVEDKNMSGIRVGDRGEAYPLIQARRICVLSTEAYTAEVAPRFLDKSVH
jgi:hypothetical protein